MRLLIFLLALMSAFFVSADIARPKIPATSEQKPTFLCTVNSTNQFTVPQDDTSACESATLSALDTSQLPPTTGDFTPYVPLGSPSCKTEQIRFDRYRVTCEQKYNSTSPTLPDVRLFTLTSLASLTSPSTGLVYQCSNPDYPDGPHEEFDGHWCYQAAPKDCPAGYHSKAVSKALGSSECMPKECPPAGTGESLASTPMTGGVPFSGGGMYCNDGCAYSVNAEQISSDKYAVGTSQGAACGDKPYDNKKLADEGDTGECSVSTGDVPLLSCPNANPTTPEKDPHNNDDSKTPEDETPEKPKETCAADDAACNLKNVETEIENSTNKQIDNDNKLHNKKIDADTKNTNALLNILESIDTSILLQTQQDDRLHAVTVSKFNELVDAVNGIETGGGGGGGNGNGDGSGGDCEGSPSECVPIEGADIPNETVNLNQYADKYDDWLPNAELPSEKCIVISTGRSLCLSFESFILLFQSISGLMVIGALMHSARIISGAI